MRTLSSVGLVLSVLALTACEDSTGVGGIWRSPIGTLNASGNASVELPPSAGNTSNLPALTCYTANPADPPDSRVWFAVGSVELPLRVDPQREVLSNCILEGSPTGSNRLMATLEGETPGWLYQFVVVY
jgi:hypothetical protein